MTTNKDIWKKRGLMLKAARINKGLLQKDVADLLKLKVNTISGYENGLRKMDFDDIKKICRFLGIDLNSF